MRWKVSPDVPVPPWRQIVEQALDAVASGALGPGERLPSVRDAASALLVNPNTVARAYRELEEAGVVEGRAGTGVFVTDAGPALARRDRRAATLSTLRRAAREALRAGHPPEKVTSEVEAAVQHAREEASRREAEARKETT